jgi:hypothetical protein
MTKQNINISADNVEGKCDQKCSYAFKYSESNSTATNNGVLVSITYDGSSVPPVTYNTEQYTVSGILLISPSIHTFNNSLMPAELIVEHVPVNGGNQLNVCIPLSTSGDHSNASAMVTDIIKKVATNAPSHGDSTNLNMSNFNLQTIVPRKPYYAYVNNQNDWIVYGALEAIAVGSSTIKTLQQIIKPFPIPTPGDSLFYNSNGPITGVPVGDGIYISCQPTGSSGDDVGIMYDKPSSSVDFSNVANSPLLQFFIVIFVMVVLYLIIFYGIGAMFSSLSASFGSTLFGLPTTQPTP